MDEQQVYESALAMIAEIVKQSPSGGGGSSADCGDMILKTSTEYSTQVEEMMNMLMT